MLPSWVMNEMNTVSLNDRRLDERLRVVLSQLAERESITTSRDVPVRAPP